MTDMFSPESQAIAEDICKRYEAMHLLLSLDGHVFAVTEHGTLLVQENPDVQLSGYVIPEPPPPLTFFETAKAKIGDLFKRTES